MNDFEFQSCLQQNIEEIESILAKYLPKEEGYQKNIFEAMNYSILAGGKRLRPMLMRECYKMFGGNLPIVEPFMAAMEMIHTYSLVHDDLPAMDNDEYRRGKKTTWYVYGDAMGILAGDALLNYAMETALKAVDIIDNDLTLEAQDINIRDFNSRILKALKILFTKSGVYGMIGGQVADVLAEKKSEKLSEEQLLFIHEHKTAALIQASMMVGAVLAGASDDELMQLEKCGYNIGIAFQIQDDILDVIGDSETLGKMVGSDAQNDKQTYVTINGIEKSKSDVEKLSNEAIDILNGFSSEHDFLEKLILQLINRDK